MPRREVFTTPEQMTAGIDRFATRVVTKVVLDVVANLVKSPGDGGTPVDTGWARSNWLVSIAAPQRSVLGEPDAVQAHPSPLVPMLSYHVRLGPVFVSNNVPYITRLDDGSSQQAPSGFVGRAVHKAVVVDSQNLLVRA